MRRIAARLASKGRTVRSSVQPFGEGVGLGKPYRNELDLLPETFDWAVRQDLRPITRAINASSFRSILAIGSGGSMAAADYLAALHTHLSGHLSASQTPLEFLRSEARMDESAVWLLFAGGKNLDILRSIRKAIQVEPDSTRSLVRLSWQPTCQTSDTPRHRCP